MRVGALLTSRTAAFARCCYLAEGFRRRLQGLTDGELIITGKTVSPEASHWEDPKTIAENARKYEICKEEWRRRHPKTD
jgi:hypothetical protein